MVTNGNVSAASKCKAAMRDAVSAEGLHRLYPAHGPVVDAAVEKAGEGAWYTFDYASQEAMIMAPDGDPVPIKAWVVRARCEGKYQQP